MIDLIYRSIILTGVAWRRQHGYVGAGGVVIVVGGYATAWINELRNPEHWEPGTIAVDELGHTWRAVGGNAKGAALWMPTNSASWRSAKNRTDRWHR